MVKRLLPIVLLLSSGVFAEEKTQISGITLQPLENSDFVSLNIYSKHKALSFDSFYLPDPERLVVDLAAASFIPQYRRRSDSEIEPNIRGAEQPDGSYRLVLDDSKPLQVACQSRRRDEDRFHLELKLSPLANADNKQINFIDIPQCIEDNHTTATLGDTVELPHVEAKPNELDALQQHAMASKSEDRMPEPVVDEELEFDMDAIMQHNGLSERQLKSLLSYGVADGDYLLDLLINKKHIGKDWVRVNDGNLCFLSAELLQRFITKAALINNGECFLLSETQTAQQLDVHAQRLNLVLSEQYVINDSNGFQRGGEAIAMNYTVNYRDGSIGRGGSFSGQTEIKAFWNNWIYQSRQSYFNNELFFNDSYVQRDFTSYGLRLQAGRIATSGFVLNGFRYDGIRLQSNNNQIQNALLGLVSGNTAGPATVTIKQNGIEIYQNMVPGGDYTLSNFMLRNSRQPLTVTEQLADGTEQSFDVPARLAIPERFFQPSDGLPNYYFSAGVTENSNTAFVMSGIQLDSQLNPWQQAFDIAFFDEKIANAGYRLSYLTTANTNFDVNYRLSWAPGDEIATTGQQIFLNGAWSVPLISLSAGAQYNSRYFVDPLQRYNPARNDLIVPSGQQIPSSDYMAQSIKYNVSLNGSFSLTDGLNSSLNLGWFWQQDYEEQTSQSFRVSWVGSYQGSSFSIGYSKALNSDQGSIFNADLRIPFGDAGHQHNLVQRYSSARNRDQYNLLLSGTHPLANYSLGYNHDLLANSNGYSASVNGQTQLANLGLNYSHTDDYNNTFATASGSVVLTPKAVAIGPHRAGDTVVLVSTKNVDSGELVSGVKLQGQQRPPLLPYSLSHNSSAYRQSNISLDQHTLSTAQEVVYGRTKVRPMAGTVLHEQFLIREVSRFLLTVRVGGVVAPDKSHLYGESGELIGVTDSHGQIFISDSRISTNKYFLELPDETECRFEILWDSIADSGNEFFKVGEAQCVK